jgi:GH24 family phage-related lysozyme (muramidase)
MIIEAARKLILSAEGLNQPGKWPGAKSGITIGIGYDLGYATVDQFESDWGAYLAAKPRERLKGVVGFSGVKAKNRAPALADIRIRRADAEEVFTERTLPRYEFLAAQAFPGYDALPPEAQGALVSLVYNRGASMVDKPGEDRRKEMRAIRDAVAAHDLQEIANQLRSMKRLWIGQGVDGLLARREAEAQLVESAIRPA